MTLLRHDSHVQKILSKCSLLFKFHMKSFKATTISLYIADHWSHCRTHFIFLLQKLSNVPTANNSKSVHCIFSNYQESSIIIAKENNLPNYLSPKYNYFHIGDLQVYSLSIHLFPWLQLYHKYNFVFCLLPFKQNLGHFQIDT